MIKRRIEKKRKRVLRKDRISLFQLEENLEVGFVELAVPKPFPKR